MEVVEKEQKRVALERVTIRFAGDSGDGMQLTGSQFTNTSAFVGNDISTFPDFPAEIRAPAGTLGGVSGFQVSFSHHDIHTPGDQLNALIAMNPAALHVNIPDLEEGGLLIVNSDHFSQNDLKKAEYTENPLEDGSLDSYRLIPVPITSMTLKAVEDTGLSRKHAGRCKNFFALGLLFWLYGRPLNHTKAWITNKFGEGTDLEKANHKALDAGYNYAITAELFENYYQVAPAPLEKGTYRQITGNQALAWGCIAASEQSGMPLLVSSYPITPASDILHELARYQHFGVKTFQAEDEIAAICAAIGASFGGTLGFTSTSGPGLDLKSEALGLAVMAELPIVVSVVQRGGPSTGLPTKTEQADLLQALYGRHGECPLPVLAPSTPSECFDMAIEAFRIALKYRTPVILLSDGYLANGTEPWKIPDVQSLPAINPNFHTNPEGFTPYTRDPETLARQWAIPGTPGLEHRIGGLEKDSVTGSVSYDAENHQKMVHTRAAKVENIVNDIPEVELLGAPQGKVLVVAWGGTHGSILSAVEGLQAEGKEVSYIHVKYLSPFPKGLEKYLNHFEHILVPELNQGQLCSLIRAKFLVDAISYSKVKGKPFLVSEIRNRILELL